MIFRRYITTRAVTTINTVRPRTWRIFGPGHIFHQFVDLGNFDIQFPFHFAMKGGNSLCHGLYGVL